METALAILTGLFFAAATYLLLSKSLVRVLIGVALLGNGVNLLIFTAGRLTRIVPPIVPAGQESVVAEAVANPLPQALILTAIVIGFSLLSFLFVLAYRAIDAMKTDNINTMRVAEPEGGPQPPLSY